MNQSHNLRASKSSASFASSNKEARWIPSNAGFFEPNQHSRSIKGENERRSANTSPRPERLENRYMTSGVDLRDNQRYDPNLEKINIELRSENNMLASKLSEKMRIIEDWENKYRDLEKSRASAEKTYSQNANLNVEIHRLKDDSTHSRSLEAELSKLRPLVEILTREKNGLHVLLSEKENIILELRNKLEGTNGVKWRVEEQNFESSRTAVVERDNIISELRLKLARFENQSSDANEWRTKSLSLAAENQRLIRSLEEKAIEVELLRARKPVEQVSVVSVQEMTRLEAVLSEKSRECDLLRSKLIEREKVVVSPVKSEYQEKYLIVSDENERLNASVNAKQREIESLNVKLNDYHEIESKLRLLSQEKSKLVIERDSLVQERTRLEGRLIEKDHAYDVLKVKIRESERPSTELLELKQKLAVVTSENERLNVFINEKRKEIEALNARTLEYHDLELRLKLLIDENNENVAKREAAVEEKRRLEAIVSEINEEYGVLNVRLRENEKVFIELSELKGRLSDLESENERLNALVVESQRGVKALESEILEYKEINSKLKITIRDNERVIEENKRVIEDNRRIIIEKEREVETHKTSPVLRSIDTDFSVVRTQVSSPVVIVQQESNVSIEVSKLERELSLRVSQIRQLEEKVALLLIQNKQLMQERAIIDTTFSVEVKELETLRLRSSEANILIMQLKLYENEKEETLKLIDKDRRLFERSLHEKELVIKELQAKSIAHEQRIAYFNDLKAKITRITTDNERLVFELQEKSREIETLRTELHHLSFRSSKVVVQETNTSEILLNDKTREISSLKARIALLEKGSILNEELREKLRTSSIKYETIINGLNVRLNEMEALRVRWAQLSDIEARLNLVTRERDEAVNYERLNRKELASYQEKIVKLEAQLVELTSFKQLQLSTPRFVQVEKKSFDKEAELNVYKQEIANYQEKLVKLEAQVTELSTIKSHHVQVVSSPAKVVHVESKNVEKEKELNGVIVQLREKLEQASKEVERLTVIVSQKESEIVNLKQVEVSKQAEALVLVQKEKEEAIQEKNRLVIICEEYVKEIESLRVQLKDIEVFGVERQRLIEIVNTKSREIAMLEQTLAVYESEKLSLKQIACEKEKVIEEMELKLFAKDAVNEVRMNHQIAFGKVETQKQTKNSVTEKTVKSRLSYLTGFNEEFESMVVERDQLEVQVAEKQKDIKELQAKVVSVEKELALANSGEWQSKVTLLDSESKRLNNVALERLAKLNASEQQLRESTKERSLLGLEVSEKQVEINLLRTKMADFEKQTKLVTELQGKLAMMVLENDRLIRDLEEKNQFIADLKHKYATLESLYILVRGNMKKAEGIDKKYHDMIGAIEQVESKLGLYGKSKAMKKTVSVQSILQMDSPTYSLNTSPLAESKVVSATIKSASTTEKTKFQKAIF